MDHEQRDAGTEHDQRGLLEAEWEVPWHAHTIPLALATVLVLLWLSGVTDQAAPDWQLSSRDLARGQMSSLFLHMLAHGGALHVLTNSAALAVLGGPLIAVLGEPPTSWLRFMYIFVCSGVSGAVFFLLLNAGESAVLLGASGAIFGILGALARVHPLTGTVVPIASRRTWLLSKFFVYNHAVLFVIVGIAALLAGQVTALAWEAHLGGLLFGFFAAPLFLERRP